LNLINHLHIPRCSGIYIKSHIVNDLKSKGIPYFATNHGEVFPQTFKNKAFISGHFGLTPLKYVSNLINICLVRNPIDRLISNFVYVVQPSNKDDIEGLFENWIENDKQHNLQSRFLSKPLDEALYNSLNHGNERAANGWCLEEGPIDMGKVKEVVDSIDLLDTLDNHGAFITNLNELLFKAYGFRTFSNRNLINENFRAVSLPDTLMRRIADLNSLDMELYDYVKSKG
jgi:hypothetical protein